MTMNETTIRRKSARSVMERAGSSFFNVTFIKKDGTERSMIARYGVTKGVLGDDACESAQKALQTWRENNPNLIRLFDVKKDAFRTVNLDTIIALRVMGVDYKVI